MKWIDMHCDTLSEIIRQNKELKRNDLCADLERLTQGGAYAQFLPVLSMPPGMDGTGGGQMSKWYGTWHIRMCWQCLDGRRRNRMTDLK